MYSSDIQKYPKVSQEQVMAVTHILTSVLSDPNYLSNSTYSQLMQKTISEEAEKIKNGFASGAFNSLSSIDDDINNLANQKLAKNESLDSLPKSELNKIKKEAHQQALEEAREEVARRLEEENRAATEKDQELAEKQFESLAVDLENRPKSYRDEYGILIRLELLIRSVERIANRSNSDSSKLSASSKLMEYQEKQVEILERLLNLEKTAKIEKVTRRFFLELKKHPDLSVVADRYLNLLNDIE